MKPWQQRLLAYSSLYLLVGALLYGFQRHLLYFPSEYLQHNYPELQLHNADVTINIVVLNPGQEKALIYFGGNAETVLNSAYDLLVNLPDYSLYLFNYRGYSGSTGKPSEAGIYADALLLYQYLQPRHRSISLIGRSLGSGVATYVAAHAEIEKLILITPFDSIEHLAQDRFMLYPMRILLKDKFDSQARVPMIRAQTRVILAANDKIVPQKNSQNLIQAFPAAQIKFSSIAGTQHNDIIYHPAYLTALKQYLYD